MPFSSPGDLPNPGIEPILPHCRWIFYCLSHQGSQHQEGTNTYRNQHQEGKPNKKILKPGFSPPGRQQCLTFTKGLNLSPLPLTLQLDTVWWVLDFFPGKELLANSSLLSSSPAQRHHYQPLLREKSFYFVFKLVNIITVCRNKPCPS